MTIHRAGDEEKAKADYNFRLSHYEGHEIAIRHHPQAFLNDLFAENKYKRFSSVLISGSQGSGKSTLRRMIAHEGHTKHGFYIANFMKSDLEQLDERLLTLPADRNLLLTFEDVSLAFKTMKSGKKNEVLQVITEARHPKIENAGDRRIICISEIHYGPAMEKMMRSFSPWKIYTDMSVEEMGNFAGFAGKKYAGKVRAFQHATLSQFRKGEFTIERTPGTKVTYKTDDPFRFCMCYDGAQLRFILVAKKSCFICDKHWKQDVNCTPQDVWDVTMRHCKSKRLATRALNTVLLENGFSDGCSKDFAAAVKRVHDIISVLRCDRDKLATFLRKQSQLSGKPYRNTPLRNRNYKEQLSELRNGNGHAIPQEPEQIQYQPDPIPECPMLPAPQQIKDSQVA